MEASRRANTEKSTSSLDKCKGFAHCFLRLQWRGASWILTTRSYGTIRNITLKLCVDCEKQFVRNAQNCRKINHGFCIMIMHQLTHIDACAWVFGNNNRIQWTWPPLAFLRLPKLKTPLKGKLFATIEEIKEKSKQKVLAITKSAFQKCCEDWKKRWHRCILSERGHFEGDKIVIDK